MTKKKNLLKEYRSKRHFDKTKEPRGNKVKKHKEPIFVIHKHDARNLHYDLRLEDEGVLKSWAIPKGPSTDPKDRHLAMQTEDHPIEYAEFEGVIPESEYGAGPVMIWDYGTFKNLKEGSLSNNLKKGEIAIWLDGKKLKGGYALIKTKYQDRDNAWILLKMKDDEAKTDYEILEKEPKSVVSNCTLEEISKKLKKCKLKKYKS